MRVCVCTQMYAKSGGGLLSVDMQSAEWCQPQFDPLRTAACGCDEVYDDEVYWSVTVCEFLHHSDYPKYQLFLVNSYSRTELFNGTH